MHVLLFITIATCEEKHVKMHTKVQKCIYLLCVPSQLFHRMYAFFRAPEHSCYMTVSDEIKES